MQRKQSNKKEMTYQYLDINLINSLIQNNNYSALIDYARNLESKFHQGTADNKYIEELKACQNIISNYFISIENETLINELLCNLIEEIDLFPEIYEKVCAKLIDNKTPEEATAIYKKIKNQFFCIPSHTILEFISTSTKKADTCLFFINDLEKSYQKYGNKSYDKFILDFYQRFRAVCTKEEYEKFIESGMQPENNPQKQ